MLSFFHSIGHSRVLRNSTEKGMGHGGSRLKATCKVGVEFWEVWDFKVKDLFGFVQWIWA